VLGHVPGHNAYMIMIVLFITGSLTTWAYYKSYGKRLAFWV